MINFRLKDFDKIIPVGQEPDLYLSWFWLTDGDLWLSFGETTIYEYSKEALIHFGDKPTPYNDYYLVRFIEDFTDLFGKISESIPTKFYTLTANLNQFFAEAEKRLDIYDTDDDEYSDFYFEQYDKLISWAYQRSFNSAHLVGGPSLSFYRCNDKIRIAWNTEYTLENGITLWTAKNGSYEMDYAGFIEKLKEFGLRFFKEMDRQIALTVEKNWENIKIDKKRLIEEHKERKEDFYLKLSLLEQVPAENTNWPEIEELYDRMIKEITQ